MTPVPLVNYVDPPDCPEGMTLAEYRRTRSRPRRRTLRQRFWRRLQRARRHR